MSDSNKITETFSEQSSFITTDARTKRWAIPYHYEALNGRVEKLIIDQHQYINGKRILDLGCHFGTFSYASLFHGASFCTGVDTESNLLQEGEKLFAEHAVEKTKYEFIQDEVVAFLRKQPDNAYDTILCLGIFYYLNDIVTCLQEMQRVAKETIILDTFTAYYGACVSKEGEKISKSTVAETYELPMVLYPFTKSKKRDYTVYNNFAKGEKYISIISLRTIPALENFFELFSLNYQLLEWNKYYSTNYFTWKDFITTEVKYASHWADIYYAKLRVAYVLNVKQ